MPGNAAASLPTVAFRRRYVGAALALLAATAGACWNQDAPVVRLAEPVWNVYAGAALCLLPAAAVVCLWLALRGARAVRVGVAVLGLPVVLLSGCAALLGAAFGDGVRVVQRLPLGDDERLTVYEDPGPAFARWVSWADQEREVLPGVLRVLRVVPVRRIARVQAARTGACAAIVTAGYVDPTAPGTPAVDTVALRPLGPRSPWRRPTRRCS